MPAKSSHHISFYCVEPDMKSFLRHALRGHNVSLYDEPLHDDNLDPHTTILGVFLESHIDAEVLKKLKKLELIAAMSTGVDHIDLNAAKKYRVHVSNVPSYGEVTVAEHALALMLTMSRRIVEAVTRVKRGSFDYHALRGFDLTGKTVGVIGTGHIGTHLINLLRGFEVTILAYDEFQKSNLETEFPHASYVPLKKLLAESDVVSLHVPLLKGTHHLMNKQRFSQMKKGSYLINTARGGLVDAAALIQALDSGHIAGAALDTLEDEPSLQHHSLLLRKNISQERVRLTLMNELLIDHPRTIVTPHNAFNTKEALHRIMQTTVDNINSYLLGKPLNDVSRFHKT